MTYIHDPESSQAKINLLPQSKKGRLFLLLTVLTFANCVRLFYSNSHTILAESFDTGWIVRTGEFVLHNGPPHQDIYSWTNQERPFIAYQWLFEVACYLIQKAGGLWLLGLSACTVTGILYLAILPHIWRRLGIPFWISFLLLSLVLTPHWFNIRPQLVSYPLLLLLAMLLEKNRTSKGNGIWCIPLLMVFWVNIHTFFAFGLGVLAIYTICSLIREGWRESKGLLSVLILSLAASLLNPYGMELTRFVFGFLNGDQFLGMREAQSSLTDPSAHFVFAYFIILWTVMFRQRKKLSAESLIICALITLAAIGVRRYQSIAVLLTWPYFGIALANSNYLKMFQDHKAQAGIAPPSIGLFILSGMSVIVALLSCFLRVGSEQKAEQLYCEGNQDVIRYYTSHKSSSDRLFNDPTTGSWLVYFGAGPVFIDTRYDMYPKDFTEKVVYCIRAGPGWNDYLAKYNATMVLMRDDWSLITSALQRSKDWKLVVDNGRLALWIRNSSKLAAQLDSWKVSDGSIRKSGLPKKLIDETIQSRCRQYFARSQLNLELKNIDCAVEDLRAAVHLLPESRFLKQKLKEAKELQSNDRPGQASL